MDRAETSRPGETWLNSPCTDPIGRVFTRDGRIFRAIYPHKSALVRRMLATPQVAQLMANGLLAKTWIADRVVPGTDLVVEAERAPFDVPCDRFIGSCLQASLERWIEISLYLEGSGFCLSDAHFGNFMLFGGNQPRWTDLGSVRPAAEITPDTPFRSFDELWTGMLSPLLVLRQGPQRARLARLAIADYPYQGPRTVATEPPLPLHEFVARQRDELQRAIGAATGRDALLKTFEFACGQIGNAFSRPAAAVPTGPIDAAFVRQVLGEAGVRSVACLGSDVYGALANGLDAVDTVVVDEDETRLEQLATALASQPRSGAVALYLEHVINRIFVRHGLKADAVLAFDPFRRFAHNSDVMLENIAGILARMAKTMAMITTPREFASPVAALLRAFFADVHEAPARAPDVTFICRTHNVS